MSKPLEVSQLPNKVCQIAHRCDRDMPKSITVETFPPNTKKSTKNNHLISFWILVLLLFLIFGLLDCSCGEEDSCERSPRV